MLKSCAGLSWNECRRLCLAVPLAWVLIASLISTAAAQSDVTRERRYRQFQEKRQEILQSLQSDLQSVQAWCTERNLPQAIDEIGQLSLQLLAPPAEKELPRMAQPPVSTRLPLDEQQWRLQLLHHRTERAKEMYSMARAALRAGFPSLAFTMIGDVVRLDPDHKYARSVLGFQLFSDPARADDKTYAGEWVTAFEAQMRRGNPPQLYDRRFGWIPVASLTRYEQGLRPWRGEWISEVKEAELRRDFRNAWEVRSEHFLVKTNVSLQAGVELSEKLEIFYSWLQQHLAAFFDTPEAMQERFEEAAARRGSRRTPPPLQVHYYATREEYDRRVQDKVPATIVTNGLYWQPDRTCYFFAKEDPDDLSTLFHEATHQILDTATIEARNLAERVRARRLKQRNASEWVLCENSNFWMIEGLACYFESFEIVDGQVRVGRPDFVRFDTARQRLLDPDVFFYLPFRQFFSLGKDLFQRHPNVSQFYTQASGTVHFMMHYEDGMYRDDFVRLLAAAYRPDPERVLEEPAFDKIAGVSFEDLDRQYRIHMQNLETQILQSPNPSSAVPSPGAAAAGRRD